MNKMASKCLIILTIITFCFGLSNFVVDARTIKSNGVVKTIQTEDGAYDCVDFYKQRAFDHPSLKNHSFYPEMRPSFRPNSRNSNEISDEGLGDFEIKGDTCPDGTVPIRNIKEEDPLISKLRVQSYAQLGETHTDTWSESRIYFAIGQSTSDVTKVFNGIAANITVWNPFAPRYGYSSSEIIIKSGNDAIIVGWTVNPMVYKDNNTRFFIYTVSGDQHCMNSKCGFIQTNKNVPLDNPISPYSTLGGQKMVYRFFVYRDPQTGNWWLEDGFNKRVLGFWPKSFFHGLSESGMYVACGGETYSPDGQIFPQMGSGYKTKSKYPRESFCKNVEVLDATYTLVPKADLEPYGNNQGDYGIVVHDKGDDHHIYFGGPSD